MTLAELQAEKTNLQAAINKALAAQEYSEGATRVKKASIDILYDRLDKVNAQISRLTNGTISLRPIFKDAK